MYTLNAKPTKVGMNGFNNDVSQSSSSLSVVLVICSDMSLSCFESFSRYCAHHLFV